MAEITEEMIRAGAIALAGGPEYFWEHPNSDRNRQEFRDRAGAVLEAAALAAPQEPSGCLCYGANGVTEPMCPACTATDDREKLAEAEFKNLPVGSIVTVEEHWYGAQAAILGDTEDGPRWWTTLDAPSGNGDGYTPSTMWSYYGEEDAKGVTLIRRGSVALAAPVAVDIATALRFCTCSHWLEAHYKRKCVEFACACQDFSPVVAVDEAKLAEVINEALDAWQGEERSEVFVASAIAKWLCGDRA